MFWVDVHTARMRYKASIETKPFSQVITWIRTFSNFLPAFEHLIPNLTVKRVARLLHILEAWASNLDKQSDHQVSKEYVYWGWSGLSATTEFQSRRERVVKQAAESLPRQESFGMWRRVHSWMDRCEFLWNMVPTSSWLMLCEELKWFLLTFGRRIRTGAESVLTGDGDYRVQWVEGAEGWVGKRKREGKEWNTIK